MYIIYGCHIILIIFVIPWVNSENQRFIFIMVQNEHRLTAIEVCQYEKAQFQL